MKKTVFSILFAVLTMSAGSAMANEPLCPAHNRYGMPACTVDGDPICQNNHTGALLPGPNCGKEVAFCDGGVVKCTGGTAVTKPDSGFPGVGALAALVCGPTPIEIPDVLAALKPPIQTTVVNGDLDDHCEAVCKDYKTACDKIVITSRNCHATTGGHIATVVQEECMDLPNPEKGECIDQAAMERNANQDNAYDEAELAMCDKDMCVTHCLANVTAAP